MKGLSSSNREERKITVEINARTIVRIFIIVAAILLLVYLRTIFLLFVSAFILMAALRPSVDWLVKHKVPRAFSVFFVFLVGFFFFGAVLYLVSPPLIEQLNVFIQNFPDLAKAVLVGLGERVQPLSNSLTPEKIDIFFSSFKTAFASKPADILSSAWSTVETAMGFFGSIISVIMGVSLAIYMVIERDRMVNSTLLFFSPENREHVKEVFYKVESKVGAWLRGQIILCVIVGVATWLVLTVIGVKYAVALGVLAGILEIVPVVGPILAGIPVVVTGFSMSAWQGIASFIAAVTIQQLENTLLVPVVMKKAVGLNPVVTLMALLIGSKLFDVVGAIVAVPVAGIVTVLVDEYLASRGIIIDKGVGKGDKDK